mgnify:CR=1 FL=1
MDIIRKLPFFSGSTGAILAGIISFAEGADKQTIYIRMAVTMILFYVLGIYVKKTVISVREEAENRKRENQAEEAEKRKRNDEKKEEAANRKSTIKNAQMERDKSKDTAKAETASDDQQDDFEPLALSRAIKTKVKE